MDFATCSYCGNAAVLQIGTISLCDAHKRIDFNSAANAKLPNQPVKIQVGVPPARE